MESLQLPSDVEAMSAQEILRFCLDTFPGRVSLACSFQKEESVLLDMLLELEPKARVFAIDTHYLFLETYELWREVERRYATKVEVFEGPSPAEPAAITLALPTDKRDKFVPALPNAAIVITRKISVK